MCVRERERERDICFCLSRVLWTRSGIHGILISSRARRTPDIRVDERERECVCERERERYSVFVCQAVESTIF